MAQAEDDFAVRIGAAGESRSSHHPLNAGEGPNVPSGESSISRSAVDLVLPGPGEAVQAGPGDAAGAIPKMVLSGSGRAVGPAALVVDVERRRLIGRRGVAMRLPHTDPLDEPTVHLGNPTPQTYRPAARSAATVATPAITAKSRLRRHAATASATMAARISAPPVGCASGTAIPAPATAAMIAVGSASR